MKSAPRPLIILAIFAAFAFDRAQAQNSTADSPALDVDKVIVHPETYKGKISVSGRVAKVDAQKNLLLLGCEDACVAMPVKFTGAPPKVGSEVVVHGKITKDADGRYLFDAETVTPKK